MADIIDVLVWSVPEWYPITCVVLFLDSLHDLHHVAKTEQRH